MLVLKKIRKIRTSLDVVCNYVGVLYLGNRKIGHSVLCEELFGSSSEEAKTQGEEDHLGLENGIWEGWKD